MLEKLVSFCKRMLLNEALFCDKKLFSECVCEIELHYNTYSIVKGCDLFWKSDLKCIWLKE